MTENQRPHCVVIGVGTGTGLACAKKFVAEGYKVSIARKAERLQGFVDELEHSTAYPTDITNTDNFRATLQQIAQEQGAPEKFIYNASLAIFGTYETLEPGDLERHFRANTPGLLIVAPKVCMWLT
jgi:NADP-dependent 3-hydroxy acid dehydrogenase YdfG